MAWIVSLYLYISKQIQTIFLMTSANISKRSVPAGVVYDSDSHGRTLEIKHLGG